jgi:hypothetical protein
MLNSNKRSLAINTKSAEGKEVMEKMIREAAPDLGPNVLTFDPSMSSSAIQGQLNNIFHQQETN